ncbi:MAG: hypothetical protein ABIO48_09025 [Pedococcus sp.]
MGLTFAQLRGAVRQSRVAPWGAPLLIAACVVTSACGPPRASDVAEAATPPTPQTPGDIVLPFDAYQPSAPVQRIENDAYRELVRRCAIEYGVALLMPAAELPVESNARRYGLFDPADAKARGYVGKTVFVDAVRAGRWAPTPQQKYVLNGEERPPGAAAVPTGGCAQRAESELGLPDTSMADVEAAGLSSFKLAADDPRVAAAERAWSSCLAEQDLHYAKTFDPSNHPWKPRASPEEIRTAVADVACKQRTNLVGAWLAAETQVQRRVIGNDPEAFAALPSWRAARLEHARAVLAQDAG